MKLVSLSRNIALRNDDIKPRELNFAVQRTTDRQIDQLVYQLYNLTPTEITIVEA